MAAIGGRLGSGMSAIIVLGQGRSGTSTVAGILHHLGVYMGEGLLPSTPDNPKGSFEDARFVDIHTRMIGGDWKHPKISAMKVDPLLPEYEALVEDMNRHELWGLKDPRLCFTFPYLMPLLGDDTKIVTTLRSWDSRIRSLAAMADVGGLGEAAMIDERYFEALMDCYKLLPLDWPSVTVYYDVLLANPRYGVEGLAAWLGLELNEEAVKFVDPELRHWR
jgi:hypothetical protein